MTRWGNTLTLIQRVCILCDLQLARSVYIFGGDLDDVICAWLTTLCRSNPSRRDRERTRTVIVLIINLRDWTNSRDKRVINTWTYFSCYVFIWNGNERDRVRCVAIRCHFIAIFLSDYFRDADMFPVEYYAFQLAF